MSSTYALADEDLLPEIYSDLKRLASRKLAGERADQSLGATDLVHEAFLRLRDATTRVSWVSQSHYLVMISETMRRVLVDRARRRKTLKRGRGRRQDVPLDEVPAKSTVDSVDVLALDEALTQLEATFPRQAAVVKLRYFGGLTNLATAEVLGVSRSTVDSDWVYGRAKLRAALSARASG